MEKIIYFKEYYTNSNGIWFFVCKDYESYKKNKPCKGFGQIKYPEGSIYTGEIFFDGKNYNKLGYGQQEFTNSHLGNIDPYINEKIYKYVGQFNYRKTDWIYGNGILYYKDINNKPSRFVKGFFTGLDKIKDYNGEFDYSNLLDGYNKNMESDYSARKTLFENEKNKLKEIKEFVTLFIGDSYFEFWFYDEFAKKTFSETFDCSKHLNIGLGGTTFLSWIPFIYKLKDLPQMKKIIINLGFNDLHINTSIKKTYENFGEVLSLLKSYFPNAEYYMLNVVHAPFFTKYYNKEVQLNKLFLKNSILNNISIIDNCKAINDENHKNNCFHTDGIHLNAHGYEIMDNLIKNTLKI